MYKLLCDLRVGALIEKWSVDLRLEDYANAMSAGPNHKKRLKDRAGEGLCWCQGYKRTHSTSIKLHLIDQSYDS
jgi:hypothetical protein